MRLMLACRAVLAISASAVIGVSLIYGVSQAESPCAPGASACPLPPAAVLPAEARKTCVEAKPGEQVCTEPGDAEIHATPTARIPSPPLTVEPTKGGAAL
jgi:hypothetical protein